MDQFLLQQLILAAQQQPDVLAKVLSQTGAVPPPVEGMEGNAPGGVVPPVQAPEIPAMDPGTVPGIPASMPTVPMPEGVLPGQGQPPSGMPEAPSSMDNIMKMLSVAGKAAPASGDTKPIMSGGIGSAQRLDAPKVQAGQSAMSADMIVKLLTGASQNPLRVPQLGQLMRG